MSVLSLCDGLPWILLTVDTGSTYDPPPNVYTKTPVKLLHHLFLTKMEWLSNAYLASFIQHVSIPIHRRRWHMAKNRMRSVPDEWKRAKSGRRGASCYNLTLDQDLRTEAKTGTFLKAAHGIFGTKNGTRISMWSVFCQCLIEVDGFSWHYSKIKILKLHLSSMSEFLGCLLWDGNRKKLSVPATLDEVNVLKKMCASVYLALQSVFIYVGTVNCLCFAIHVFCRKTTITTQNRIIVHILYSKCWRTSKMIVL